jgi:hypothetical protein
MALFGLASVTIATLAADLLGDGRTRGWTRGAYLLHLLAMGKAGPAEWLHWVGQALPI